MKSNLIEDSFVLEPKMTAHQITFNQHIHMDSWDDSKLNITPQTINTQNIFHEFERDSAPNLLPRSKKVKAAIPVVKDKQKPDVRK